MKNHSPTGPHLHCQAARHCLTEGNVRFGECLRCLREKVGLTPTPKKSDQLEPKELAAAD